MEAEKIVKAKWPDGLRVCFCGHERCVHILGRECITCGCAAFTERPKDAASKGDTNG